MADAVGVLVAWLDEHQGFALVVVTSVYAFFTILLWVATWQQARNTRAIYELSNRPSLVLKANVMDGSRTDHLVVEIDMHNRGNVPAEVVGWSARATNEHCQEERHPPEYHPESVLKAGGEYVGAPADAAVGTSISPWEKQAVRITFAQIAASPEPLKVHVVVTCQGVSARRYRSYLDAEWSEGRLTWQSARGPE